MLIISGNDNGAIAGVCSKCRKLLNQGLDLCVRARKLDAIERTNARKAVLRGDEEWMAENWEKHVAGHNEMSPDQPLLAKSGTIHMWVEDQYETDLADWERRSRTHITEGCKHDIKE